MDRDIGAVERKVAGGQALDLAGITNTVGVPVPSRFLRKGGSRECRRQLRLIACPQQNQIAHAASPPTPSASSGQALAKNARLGHPQREWCSAKIVKGGPPAAHRNR